MARHVIAEVSAETLRLQAMIEELSPGDQISYADVEKRAKVTMDASGKAKLRSAVRRSGRVHACVRGWGIQMASARLVMPILGQRVHGIDRAVRRADKCHSTLQEQFFSSLSPEDQKSVLFAGAIFGAIRIASSNGRFLYGKRPRELPSQTMISIPIPTKA